MKQIQKGNFYPNQSYLVVTKLEPTLNVWEKTQNRIKLEGKYQTPKNTKKWSFLITLNTTPRQRHP